NPYIIGLNWNLPGETSVDKYQQFYFLRSSEGLDCVHGRADRPSGPQHVVAQNNDFVFDNKINLCTVGQNRGSSFHPKIVPIERNVKNTCFNFMSCHFLKLPGYTLC